MLEITAELCLHPRFMSTKDHSRGLKIIKNSHTKVISMWFTMWFLSAAQTSECNCNITAVGFCFVHNTGHMLIRITWKVIMKCSLITKTSFYLYIMEKNSCQEHQVQEKGHMPHMYKSLVIIT